MYEVNLTSCKKFNKLHNATRVSLLNNILMRCHNSPAVVALEFPKKKQFDFPTRHNDIAGIFIIHAEFGHSSRQAGTIYRFI